ncbi:hypothetical protein [Dyella ginsengisoli]|uniref:hypothetical protein n=1 Tax=Dyella ginsengisoli TaxID=363848 RepID=UPI00034C9660|nr:hypothetical protein [Dyella ginsengisoli]
MLIRFAAAFVLLVSVAASAGEFKAAHLSTNNTTLQLTTAHAATVTAPSLPDQVEFGSPQISPDQSHVGWLALDENCCTSYAVPMTLVVMDARHRIRTFIGEGLPIFDWCFLPDSKSVAYMQTVLHGTSFEHFERRSLADGRLLAEYDYPDDLAENDTARKNAPAWVKCVPQ